ncbi:MAG: pilus assembly protein, partial [Anaerolineales bacterium]
MHLRKYKQAQGLVEFALLLPVLMLILIGTIEFGRILIIYTSISNAAREGSRYGVVAPADVTGITNIVRDRVILIPPADVTVTVSYDTGPGTSEYTSFTGGVGGRVIVRAAYHIQAMT